MVVNVLWQIITRFILQTPSPFTDELARYLMIWVGVLGAAYASGKKLHVAIDLVSPGIKSEKVRKGVNWSINALIMVFVLAVFVVGGIRLVYITFILSQTSPALQIPLAYVYAIIPASGLLIVYYQSFELLRK